VTAELLGGDGDGRNGQGERKTEQGGRVGGNEII